MTFKEKLERFLEEETGQTINDMQTAIEAAGRGEQQGDYNVLDHFVGMKLSTEQEAIKNGAQDVVKEEKDTTDDKLIARLHKSYVDGTLPANMYKEMYERTLGMEGGESAIPAVMHVFELAIAVIENSAKAGYCITEDAAYDVTASLDTLAAEIHKNAIAKGFWGEGVPNNQAMEKLVLVHSEVSEAVECWRNDHMMTTFEQIRKPSTGEVTRISHPTPSPGHDRKPIGFFTELADVIIRTLDLFGAYGESADEHIKQKMEYNKTRSYVHGGKKA